MSASSSETTQSGKIEQLIETGHLAQAAQLCCQRLRVYPEEPLTIRLLARILARQQRFGEAEALIRRLLGIKPNDLGALIEAALLAQQMGNWFQAEVDSRVALALDPNVPAALASLGVTLLAQDMVEQAISIFRDALDLSPNDLQAREGLICAKSRLRRPAPFESRLHRARVEHAVAIELRQRRYLTKARILLESAVELRPDWVRAIIDLGITLQQLDDLEAAIRAYREAVKIDPNAAQAWCNLGIALHEYGASEEALPAFAEALRLAPEQPLVEWNRSLALLSLGRWEEGWKGFETRWKLKGRILPDYPLWRGERLQGRTLLITSEQGLGDTLQMLRYFPLLTEWLKEEPSSKIAFACPPEFSRLLSAESEITIIRDQQQLPKVDCVCPAFSLPRIFGTTPTSIPRPYRSLRPSANPNLRDLIPQRLGMKIGLAWAGRRSHPNDHRRTCPLPFLAPLLEIPGTHFFSLQKGPAENDPEHLGLSARILPLGPHFADLADTAAAVVLLDLVITVDTVVVHLAGNLGKPTWLMLPFAAEWRWLREGETTRWYPTITLFRQRQSGDWPELVDRMTQRLVSDGPKALIPAYET